MSLFQWFGSRCRILISIYLSEPESWQEVPLRSWRLRLVLRNVGLFEHEAVFTGPDTIFSAGPTVLRYSANPGGRFKRAHAKAAATIAAAEYCGIGRQRR